MDRQPEGLPGRPRQRRRASGSWLLAVACGISLLAAVGALGWDLTETWRQRPPSASGRIATPVRGGLVVRDLVSLQTRDLVPAAQNATVTAAARTPDRATVAFALFHRRPEDPTSSSEIFAVPSSGGAPELLVPRDQPGAIFDTPVWSPDGSALFVWYQGMVGRRPVARIERVEPGTGQRRALYDDASFPAISADGQALAFVKDEPEGQALWVGSPQGEDAREAVRAGAFNALTGSQFSPDGSVLAFTTQGPGPIGRSPPSPWSPLAWLSVPVAVAHGEPWNIWTVRPDGTELRRLGSFQEDEPLLAWSPDGRWLATSGRAASGSSTRGAPSSRPASPTGASGRSTGPAERFPAGVAAPLSSFPSLRMTTRGLGGNDSWAASGRG